MPISKDFSVEDEAYLATIAVEPKMTMDEVGADIDEHGHVPVTPETATQDPFTAKGSLSYALDEALAEDTSLEHTTMTSAQNMKSDSKLSNPTDDFRNETKGEVEGTNSTPQGLIQPLESNKVGEGDEPTIQQDKAVHVKDSLAEALDSIAMDGAEEIEAKPPVGKDPEPDYTNYSEETASQIDYKAPDVPESLGGSDDKPDANGLVYVSATFTVDPNKYVSNNYRPSNMGKMPDAVAGLRNASGNMKKQAVNPEEEAAMSDLGTLEAKEAAASPDEPTEQQEKEAAKDADKEQAEEEKEEGQPVIPPESKNTKAAQDEAPEKVVLDYATFIDGSSFICFDEVADIDYSKIAMDAGIKKAPTRENCQTTFAQCRAQNPLFCRFHGPKLLEADIKTAIKATVGPGCVVQVTKDKNSKNKFTFRLTVGCPPSKKKMVEKMVHMYLTQNPGITSSTEGWNLVGKHKQTQEFEMDILQADKPPKKDTKADQMLSNTKKAIMKHEKQAVVGETAPALEKKAAKGEKWQTVDEDIENEWADLVDKTVHKSLLGNNEEFMANFNKIANQFDAAHDAGDANGLKQALEALKDEIGKYDENGEKKPEEAAATVTEEPEAQQAQAEGQPVANEEAVTEGDVIDFFGAALAKGASRQQMLDNFIELANTGTVGGKDPKGFLKPMEKMIQNRMKVSGTDHPMTKALIKAGIPLPEGMDGGQPAVSNQQNVEADDEAEFDKLVNEAEEKGLFNNDDFQKKYQQIFFDGKSDMTAKVEAMKGLMADAGQGSSEEKEKSLAVNARADYEGYEEEDKEKLLQQLNNVLSGEGFPEDVDEIPEGKPYSRRVCSAQWLDAVDSIKDKVPSLVKALTAIKDSPKKDEKANGGETTVLPAPNASSKQNPQGKSPEMKDVMNALAGINGIVSDYNISYDATNANDPTEIEISAYGDGDFDAMLNKVDSYLSNVGYGVTADEDGMHIVKKGAEGEGGVPQYSEKAHQLASKLADFQQQYKNMVDGGADSVAVNALNNALMGAKMTYDKLAAQYDAIDELDAQMKAVGEDSDLFEVDKTFEQKLLEDSKKKAEGQASVLLEELESALSGIEKSFASAQEMASDKKKGEVANSVEQTIKNLGVYVFGGKRPPQGVDSVTDYLDYLKDEFESGAAGTLTPDEQSEIEDTYFLEDAYKATKAASKAMDDAIEAFKDKMDEVPSQGEDYGTYQADIEQMQKAVSSQAVEVMAAFGAYKSALEKCKYEADAAKKLSDSKKKLEGGDAQSPVGSVTKEDIEDFFDKKYDDSEPAQTELRGWMELAEKGTIGGKSPKGFFNSVGGYYQKIMEKKGINHPMTQAFLKAGLNLPKSMEQQAQGDVSEGGKAEKLTPKQLMEGLPEDFSFAMNGNPYVYLDKDSSLSVSDAQKILEKKFNALGYKIKPIKSSSAKKAGFAYYPSVEGKKPIEGFDFDAWQKGQQAPDGGSKKAIGEVVRFDKMISSLNLPGINDAGSKLVTEIPSSATSPTDLKVGYHGKYSLSKVISLMNNGLAGSGYQVEENPNDENNIKVVKSAQPNLQNANHSLTDEEKKAKIAAMSPKQKLEAAVKIFKKKLAANPNDETAKAKLSKYEAMLAKLGK